MLLGALFKEIGIKDVPLNNLSPNKRQYSQLDLIRQAKRSNVELVWSSHFPLRTIAALRISLIVGPNTEIGRNLIQAIFNACWRDNKDPNDEKVLIGICDELGLPGKKLLDQAKSDQNIKQLLFDNNKKAIEYGIFGLPAFIVHANNNRYLYWGNDKLEWAVLESRGLLEKKPKL